MTFEILMLSSSSIRQAVLVCVFQILYQSSKFLTMVSKVTADICLFGLLYVMCKVRIRAILGCSCANLGFSVSATILGLRTLCITILNVRSSVLALY